ncbi:MazG family protein [Gracilibacillus halophilus YIM-C55.5]|uniref:MazG family protein n=1 Tax=Gracilibacillus halophilus YIM-C55.5 TaxID=1308866 RepID=N4WBG9_9BACI|nr:nucleoside triphosphate pyrophosphohydrolase [Gracilibacillus halophilus]ENH97628.1 MazG family protein [Gracilibacillus halophilus YIM-C55.5]
MQKIEVLGLGGGDINQLPLGVYRQLQNTTSKCFVRTKDHPIVEQLETEGITFTSFDHIYEKHDQFQDVYKEITEQLLQYAWEEGHIVYAVPGHPMVAERTVQLLLEQDQVTIEMAGGQSFIDDVLTAANIDPIEGFQLIDATSFERHQLQHQQHTIFSQVYDQMIASDVKLVLLEDVAPEQLVYLIEAAGSSEETVKQVPLVELDQEATLSNLTSVYVPPIDREKLHHQFFCLRDVIATLRGPNGCPWDRKQTHESLKKYLIEETYEVLEAIDKEDDDGIIEELGDILLQVMLHSQIGEDAGFFTIDDVIYSITEKMIHRHPHVFADGDATTAEEVKNNWEELKKQEKPSFSHKTVLEGLNQSLPATLYAEEMQKTVSKVGFDWDEPHAMWEKVEEELQEFRETLRNGHKAEMEDEFGDILFAMINLARYYKLNPEVALMHTNHKFQRRFSYVEQKVEESDKSWDDYTLQELDRYWEEAKTMELER